MSLIVQILKETEVILPAKVVEALRREQLRRVTNTPKTGIGAPVTNNSRRPGCRLSHISSSCSHPDSSAARQTAAREISANGVP